MHKKLLLLASLPLFIGVLFLGAKAIQACTNGRWGGWTDTSSCLATTCGTSEGTKTQSRTCEYHSGSDTCNPGRSVCDKDCPTVTFTANRTENIKVWDNCPNGWSVDPGDEGQCRQLQSGSRYHYQNRPHHHEDRIVETFNITFKYDKSADPNHCHRPTGVSLGVPSWAMNDFNNLNTELSTVNTNCRNEGAQGETQTISCNDAPITQCPPAGQCPTACGLDSSEVPDGRGGLIVCPATGACDPVGECPTSCGYEGGSVSDGQGGFIECVATQACLTPTPEPPGVGGPGPANPPVCTNTVPSAPTLLSATALGGNSINIKWNKVDGVSDYSIFYGPSSGNFLYGVPSAGNTDNFTINGLANGCFVVRAVNGCATSVQSNQVCTGGAGGQVLGASTMAGTGAAEESIFYGIFTLGSMLSGFGIRKFFSSKIK